MTIRTMLTAATLLLAHAPATAQQAVPGEPARPAGDLAQALRAAPPSIGRDASVVDWEGRVMRLGTNGWTCYPDAPGTVDTAMCVDATWRAWLDAYAGRRPVSTDRLGIAYMLLGDAGASNTDPFAESPTSDNDWVVSGPHLMILVPDPGMLEGIPTDPFHGGPFVMWKGTPYAHVMVPIAERAR